MREYTAHKDGTPRFYRLDTGHLVILDAQGYHEFCGDCMRLVFEYLGNGMHTTTRCSCPAKSDDMVTQLWRSIDECHTVEDVKRMLMVFVSAREMSA